VWPTRGGGGFFWGGVPGLGKRVNPGRKGYIGGGGAVGGGGGVFLGGCAEFGETG